MMFLLMQNTLTKSILFILLFSLCFVSCKPKKEISEKPKKEWNAELPEPNIYIEPESNSEEDLVQLKYDDYIYKDNISSAQLYLKDQPLSYPTLYLRDNKQLELHFDDFDRKYKTYSYEFIHCNANWEPSGLNTQEFIEGFFSGFIENYSYSFNTYIPYMHFQLTFPNENIQFKLSGNYLIKIYEDNDPEKIVLTKRFYIVDEQIKINSNIHIATLARYRDYKQEIDFELDLSLYPVRDPYQDLKVVILQNRRWDNAITSLKPLFVNGSKLVYNYEDNNLFDGLNEFRFFDAKNIRFQSINVDGIQIIDNKVHLFLLPEEPRSYKRYYSQQDLNGNYLIKRDNSDNSNRDGDYLTTHFTLKRESPVDNGDVYVYGQLSDWKHQEKFKMNYVEVNNEYVLTVPIKQGYYNYNYSVLPHGSDVGDMSIIEGTHSATENEYYFLIYHRKPGEIYDRLVGFEIKNSFNQFK
ncbi:MAG: DUF5103 domain-containing protein [Flavobacteriales bacterium]|nr:DUF5103 domain-containing protein [Flavobacteriales bacterium]